MKLTSAGAGAVVVSIMAGIALHGPALVEAASGGWQLLLRLTNEAPLGLSSFFLALSAATVTQPFIHRWLPDLKCPLSRGFLIESIALGIGFIVMWAQVPEFKGFVLGVIAGSLGPYLYKGFVAIGGLTWRFLRYQRRQRT